MLLWTSSYEGFGLVLIEAMSQRLPVIATSSGYASTIIRHGGNGVLVPFRSADAIAAAVGDLLDDPDRRRRLGNRAHEAVAGMTWRATAERTLAVYEAARMERAPR
jgi:glycosyltransferase involved in cell wall biosynthesis